MYSKEDKNKTRQRRHERIRKKVIGTAECPRLNVFRSNANIHAQIIDDVKGTTLVSCSSVELKLANGGNAEAARLSGIPSKNVLTFVYTLSGFMAGMAGVVCVGRLATANANAGGTYDNDAIAACIVGGASFTGGKGTIWGTLIGALLMAVIRNGLNLLGAQNDIQYIVIGSVIIVAVTIDVVRNKMEAKARKLATQ